MSERRKRGQAEQFEHLRDRALDESLKRENLFSHKREIFQQQFRCSLLASLALSSLPIGTDVLLRVQSSNIEVVHNGYIIGHIASSCQPIFDAIASDARACDLINAKVCRSPILSRSFDVQIHE